MTAADRRIYRNSRSQGPIALIFLAAVAIGLHIPLQAEAGQWQNEADLSTGFRYNDNPGFLIDEREPEGALANVTAGAASLAYRSPNREAVIRPRIQRTYYFDDDFEDLNQTDYRLRASTNTLRRRLTWGAEFSYADEGVLTAEDVDAEDPTQGGDANFLAANDRVERLFLSPSINWQLTQRDLVTLSANYANVDFDRDFTLRSDFENYGATINYSRQVTKRQSIGFLASRTVLESTRLVRLPVCEDGSLPVLLPLPIGISIPDCPPDDLIVPPLLGVGDFINDSKGTSLRFVYSFDFSEQLQFSAQVGRQNTDIESGVVLPATDDLQQAQFRSTEYNISLTHAGQRTNLQVNLSRIVQPTSFGQPADTIRLSTSFNYRLTPLITLELTGVAFQQDLRTAVLAQENQFYRADIALRWRLSRSLALVSTYTYRNQELDLRRFEGTLAETRSLLNSDSNAASITAQYRFR